MAIVEREKSEKMIERMKINIADLKLPVLNNNIDDESTRVRNIESNKLKTPRNEGRQRKIEEQNVLTIFKCANIAELSSRELVLSFRFFSRGWFFVDKQTLRKLPEISNLI